MMISHVKTLFARLLKYISGSRYDTLLANLGKDVAHENRSSLSILTMGIAGLQRHLPILINAYTLAKQHSLITEPISDGQFNALTMALKSLERETEKLSCYQERLICNLQSGRLQQLKAQSVNLLHVLQQFDDDEFVLNLSTEGWISGDVDYIDQLFCNLFTLYKSVEHENPIIIGIIDRKRYFYNAHIECTLNAKINERYNDVSRLLRHNFEYHSCQQIAKALDATIAFKLVKQHNLQIRLFFKKFIKVNNEQ